MVEYIIETRQLSKFIQGKAIVYRLNLNIPRGTLFGLLGPNGAGKSTALKLLTGRIRPTSGQISVLGHDPWKHRVQLNHSMGYLPQNPVQHKEKTVIDFLTYMARLKGYSKKEAIPAARETIHRMGLGRFEQSLVGKLSGGEKQRLGFSNALLGDPEILILDEPTASLDPEGRVYVMDLISSLARDESKTIIISSHILPEIQRMTNHIAIMSSGTVLTSGNMQELTENIYDDEYEIKCSNPQLLSTKLIESGFVSRIEGKIVFVELQENHDQFWYEVPKLCASNSIELKYCKPVRDELETLFLNLVSDQNGGDE